jgi:hypothetical protein
MRPCGRWLRTSWGTTMAPPRYPSLYQINTRVWLNRLSRKTGKPITLAEIGDTTFDRFAEQGFDWIWLLSVWQTGGAGRAVSRCNPQWRAEFKALLSDLTEDDIPGSGFAITAYAVSGALGGDAALSRFRDRLGRRGIKLMLDFVPNHTAPDHPWVKTHPDYYVEGSEEALALSPANYLQVDTDYGPKILAYGRDPNFPGWPDTLQLNYANPQLQNARIDELIAIAAKCDGVRCDMAMLLLPEIFQRTWGVTPEPFWPKAISAVHQKFPDFAFMAEVYWDLEWTLQRRVLPIATISGSTIAYGTGMPSLFVVICSLGSITRTSSRAFSKTMMSRAPHLNFCGLSTLRRQSSRICHPACGFFTRVSSTGRGCGYRPISAAARSSRGIPRLRLSTAIYCRS